MPAPGSFLVSLLLLSQPGLLGLDAAGQANTDCGPLLPPSGEFVVVANVGELQTAMSDLAPNTTILLDDGIYQLNDYFIWIDEPGVTLRSASGDHQTVVLDGGYLSTEIITIAASDVTIVDLTQKRATTITSTLFLPTARTL